MESSIPFVSTNVTPPSEIPQIDSTISDQNNPANSVVNNNYNVNVSVEGKLGGSPINKTSTTNIVKNIVQQNNTIDAQNLKKNSQENFVETGPSSLNLENKSNSNIISNYFKNETNVNNGSNYATSQLSSNINLSNTDISNLIMPSITESNVEMNNNVSKNNFLENNNSLNISSEASSSVMPSLTKTNIEGDVDTPTNIVNNTNISKNEIAETNVESKNFNTNSEMILPANQIELTDYSNPERSIGNLDGMRMTVDGNEITSSDNILYNENSFVQKREEKINQIIGHADSDNNITTNQSGDIFLSSSNVKTVNDRIQNLNNFKTDFSLQQDMIQEGNQTLNVSNTQESLNSDKLFNMTNFSENVSNNSFVTSENRSSKIDFTTTNIDTEQDDKIAEISKIVREKSLKEAETAIKEEETRKENKNKQTSKQIQGDGEDQSIDMQEDGNSMSNIETMVEKSLPMAYRGERREFPHLNASPSTISLFYQKMNSPPIWRTVSG